jgi:stage II sporulation protein D
MLGVLTRCSGYVPPGYSPGTLVPMAWSMARRLALIAALASAAVVAAPAAQARTIYTLTGHGWGHGIGLSQYGALGYAQHGWAYDSILAHYYQGTTLAALPHAVQMRIQLASGRSSYAISGASRITVVDEGGTTSKRIPAGAYRVERGSSGRLRVVNAATNARVVKHLNGPVRLGASHALQVDSTVGIGWAHDHWHGYLRVIRTGSSLMLVDVVPLEYYLRGVVPSEMPSSWLPAALRAQAVAARSYAVATRHPSSAFDAYADTRSQVYGPLEHEASASTAAVSATAHQVLWYSGAVAVGFFSSSSGGWTASEQAAWGSSGGEPYLVPVRDRYDGAGGLNPNHTWAPRVLTTRGLAHALGVKGKVRSFDLTIDGPSRRVTHAVFRTGFASHSYTGSGAELALGLRSNYFRIVGVTLKGPSGSIAGRRFPLTGRVWPRPHHRVSLLVHDGPGDPWSIATGKLSLQPDGTFSLTMHPKKNRVYRLGLSGGSVSPRLSVRVGPALTLVRSAKSFRATIYPVLRGATLTLQRHRSSGWKAVAQATVGRKGHARFLVGSTVGRWRVAFGGDAHHAASRSPVVTSPKIWRG